MTCRTDTAGAWTYTTCPDDPPVAANRLRAVVGWTAIDEITQSGPTIDYAISTQSLGLTGRVSQGGVMGLVGNPARLYPYLATIPVPIAWTLTAPGYLPRSLGATLGPVVGFPGMFTPAAPVDAGTLGTVWLHRDPIVIRGRVVQLVAGQLEPVPLAGVTVSFGGVWWTFPPANVDPTTVMQPPNLVSLHPGLYADRTSGTDTMRRRDLVQVPTQNKTLVLPSVIGDTAVRISDQLGVVAGTILAFEPALPGRVEYVAVTGIINGAATPDQPATATLAVPLQMTHEQGTDVYVMTLQPVTATQPLARAGVRSDEVAFLAGAGMTAGVVEIGGGTSPIEYQTASLYTSISDSNGYYRLPPLSRVASVKLQTPAVSLVTSPDYARYENLVDVVTP